MVVPTAPDDIPTAPDDIDAREAGNDADIALDRSIQRCIELGATTELAEEPAAG